VVKELPQVSVTHRKSVPGDPGEFDDASLKIVQEMIREAVNDLGFSEMVKGKSVLIKPNLVRPNPDFPSATTTDVRVIVALLRLCRDAGASRIAFGDKPGIGLSCRGAEKLLNLHKYTDPIGAEFVYFDESEEIWEENPDGELCQSVPVPKVLREFDVLINLPKLKLHMHTGVSLGIKNLFGLVPEHMRMRHHREDLHRFLVDYLYLVTPDLTIIDGLWALEGQAPICGTPVKDYNVLVASRDIVAADAVGSYLMGVDPDEITMIRMAASDGFGCMRLADMRILGTSPEQLRRHFIRPVLSSQDAYPGIDVMVRGACVGCLSSLRHALDRLHLAGHLKEDPQTILLGFHHEAEELKLKAEPGEMWCYGNCCKEQFVQYFEGERSAHWLEGCPPHFMSFYRAYLKALGIDLPAKE
jgi:uncharacterized protein (DUF362 family)